MRKLITFVLMLVALSGCGQSLFFAHNKSASYEAVSYGDLYNYYAMQDDSIASAGWHVPTLAEFQTLADYLGASGDYSTANTVGGALKETGTTYWDTPNTGATNSTFFNGRGGGNRSGVTGGYALINQNGVFGTKTTSSGNQGFARLIYNGSSLQCSSYFTALVYGLSLRLVKDATTLSDGESGTYTGNDGKVYRTICIGTQEWTADNLKETELKGGVPIPVVTDGATWIGLTTRARCYYDNNIGNE